MISQKIKLVLIGIAVLANSLDSSANIDVPHETFQKFIARAENKNLSMNDRWASLMKAADLARGTDVEEIKKFADHGEWFLRNAALVALNKSHRDDAMTEARKLISDKALVVRSAAVEVLSQRLTTENKLILKSEFDKAYNFHKKHSLWIRAQIAEKIAENPSSEDRDFFVKSLFDKDVEISKISARALEKMTGEKLNSKKLVESWRKYVKNNNWL